MHLGGRNSVRRLQTTLVDHFIGSSMLHSAEALSNLLLYIKEYSSHICSTVCRLGSQP